MKNLKKLSRIELRTLKGGLEPNCHCSPSGSGLPPIDTIADNAEACFNICRCYRNEPTCIR
ncbi:bacteriocin-like protein [Chryseobacterium cucumeris]|uniref:bacteriocin-like protein n=1 Tax=Chryseobacterium cucumeris TaxID=1813611 RepID=UPI003C6C91E3